ncbi:hypothetical protein M23134_01891 [Microscilla marina ATCC 23134]|uniref:Uncharacterized protein n=1 Tax=Microscilla marina ATCC 23134 TaxID=313606 RepID=A1ZC60_MICM2|nr:hypothetical protein M23134_01891 [Microscilla marina ATCC 23134]
MSNKYEEKQKKLSIKRNFCNMKKVFKLSNIKTLCAKNG